MRSGHVKFVKEREQIAPTQRDYDGDRALVGIDVEASIALKVGPAVDTTLSMS